MRYLKIILLLCIGFAVTVVLAQEEVTFTTPQGEVVRVNAATTELFDAPHVWETYAAPDGSGELAVDRGVYRAYSETEGFVWGRNDATHTDVVIEADALLLNIFTENGYGIVCRADQANEGDGYFFMVNANGYYALFLGADETLTPLVEWTPSDAIHAGIDSNHIQAICYDDYLALYANGELLIETTDATYTSGYTGLAVAAGANPVDVAFDNVSIYLVPENRSAP
ncbi:MAG: hypothetical protein J0M07_10185 [Anaerolineae bacterium]|nr:hypothetical protein [Anaerolineae bacterium]